ncbi:MAG TPA: hypothetical protein VGO47_05755, partial [Chlamydiales bacterium]|nr:hypothetical protein [Chlamydiales bacterium]
RWRLFERKQRLKRRDLLDPPEPMEAESSHFYPSHNLPSLSSDQSFSLFSSSSFNFSSSMPSPPPQCISSVSSLSNALVPSTNAGQPYESMLIPPMMSRATADRNSSQFRSPPLDTQISSADLCPTYEYNTYAPPSYSPSPSPETLLPPQEPNPISPEAHEDANPRPAKRPCVRHSHGREQARLSSHLPADAK